VDEEASEPEETIVSKSAFRLYNLEVGKADK
jgi:hypothetical protein